MSDPPAPQWKVTAAASVTGESCVLLVWQPTGLSHGLVLSPTGFSFIRIRGKFVLFWAMWCKRHVYTSITDNQFVFTNKLIIQR